jgi:hypothetical protein
MSDSRADMLREINRAFFDHAQKVAGKMDPTPFYKRGPSQVAEGLEVLGAPQSAMDELDAEQDRILRKYSDD